MSSTYLAAHVRDQLRQAQRIIELHLGGSSGRCTACGQVEPCPSRTAATTTFDRYGLLPRRRPRLAVHQERDAGFGWFTHAELSKPGADGVQPRR